MSDPRAQSPHALPGSPARRLLAELRHNLETLEPLFQRGREAAVGRFGAQSALQQPLYDAAAQLRVSALETVLAELMAAEDTGEELWAPRPSSPETTASWHDGPRLRQLYVQTIAARSMAAAQHAGTPPSGDIAERLRGLRRDCQRVHGLLAADIGEPGWRDVAVRVLHFIVPRRAAAASGNFRSAA